MNTATHNGSSVKRCARGSHGWGDRACTNPVDPKVSPRWCPACEAARRAHITKSFEALMAKQREMGGT